MKWQENKELHDKYWSNVEKVVDRAGSYSYKELWDLLLFCEITNNFQHKEPDYNYKTKYFFKNNKLNFHDLCQEKRNIIWNNINYYHDTFDFGAGWGRYSTLLAIRMPNNFIYHAELSATGRRVAEKIKKRYKLNNIKICSFNYENHKEFFNTLDISEKSNINCISSFSIEQIPEINKDFFTDFINIGWQNIRFIHIEPICWQINKTTKNTNNRYNNNLWSTLNKLKDEKIIDITQVNNNYFGSTNTMGAMIIWSKLTK